MVRCRMHLLDAVDLPLMTAPDSTMKDNVSDIKNLQSRHEGDPWTMES